MTVDHTQQTTVRASANRLGSASRPPLPTVVSPAASDEPPYDDDHLGEGYPEIDDSPPTFGAPHQLFVSVMPRASAFDYPTSCDLKRSRLAFLRNYSEQATIL